MPCLQCDGKDAKWNSTATCASCDASTLKYSSPQNKQTVLLLSKTTLQKPGYMTLNDSRYKIRDNTDQQETNKIEKKSKKILKLNHRGFSLG